VKNCGQLRNASVEECSFYANFLFGTVFVGNAELIYSFPYCEGQVILKERLLSPFRPKPEGVKEAKTKVHYFTEKSQYTNIPSYNLITMGKVYPNIELYLRAYAKRIEKIWKVLPGAEPESVRLKIEGADSLRIEDGKLIAKTSAGDIVFTPPFAYQKIEGERREVDVAYKLLSDKVYGFEIGEYNKGYPLIIDPLVYSTFIGGSYADEGYSIALDSENNTYITE
jgi:hypothetical protein